MVEALRRLELLGNLNDAETQAARFVLSWTRFPIVCSTLVISAMERGDREFGW
jgi:hypothetical protein